MNLANGQEAKDWKRTQDIACSAPTILERDPTKRFELLSEECRGMWKQEHIDATDEVFWETSSWNVFLERHKLEIVEWLRDNLGHVEVKSKT